MNIVEETLFERCDYYQRLYEESGDKQARERYIALFESIEYAGIVMEYIHYREDSRC